MNWTLRLRAKFALIYHELLQKIFFHFLFADYV